MRMGNVRGLTLGEEQLESREDLWSGRGHWAICILLWPHLLSIAVALAVGALSGHDRYCIMGTRMGYRISNSQLGRFTGPANRTGVYQKHLNKYCHKLLWDSIVLDSNPCPNIFLPRRLAKYLCPRLLYGSDLHDTYDCLLCLPRYVSASRRNGLPSNVNPHMPQGTLDVRLLFSRKKNRPCLGGRIPCPHT